MNEQIKVGKIVYDCMFDRSHDYQYVVIDGNRKYFKHCNGCGKIQLYGLKLDMIRQLDKKSKCLDCRNYKGENHPMFGRRQSEHVKQMVSKANTGRVPSIKQRKQHSIRMSGKNHPLYGTHQSSDTKKKMRLTVIRKLQEKYGYDISPRYNLKSCKYFESLNSNRGWNLQYANNGGEFFVKNLGYWVDGYDKNRNIVVEYDEPKHYDVDGNLRGKDVTRQREIIETLKCEFYRYNERLGILVKIN